MERCKYTYGMTTFLITKNHPIHTCNTSTITNYFFSNEGIGQNWIMEESGGVQERGTKLSGPVPFLRTPEPLNRAKL